MKRFKEFNPEKLKKISYGRMSKHKKRRFAYKKHEGIFTNFEDFRSIEKPKWIEHIPGGKAQGMIPDDFDQEQLNKGKEIQMEHTDDPMVATEIAMDHLKEWEPLPYYDYLDDMEKEIEDDLKRKQLEKNNIYIKNNRPKMKTKFNQFINESENNQKSKKDDKFKFQIEYSPEIVDDLELHNVKKVGDKDDGDWILLNVLTLEYSFMDEPIEGIKMTDESRFQHIMGNL